MNKILLLILLLVVGVTLIFAFVDRTEQEEERQFTQEDPQAFILTSFGSCVPLTISVSEFKNQQKHLSNVVQGIERRVLCNVAV